MKEKPHYRGSYNRKTTKFLQRLTADHLVGRRLSRKRNWVGCEKSVNALNLMDVHTKLIACYPVRDKSFDETVSKLRMFCGDRKIGRIYSDNSGELIKVTKALKIPHEGSQPGGPAK